MTDTATATDCLESIRHENLSVYRVSPGRLKEDVGQEAEIAHDYRGRLVYELLQNADDAMLNHSGLRDRVVFRLTDDELWVGNSGRPLDEADVAGLCGIGASRKSDNRGPRRASIGHKGMGFKSVLEVTETPEAYSERFQFRMDASVALEPVREVMRELSRPRPDRVPAMRFPWRVNTVPDLWHQLHDRDGIETLFRFPLRSELSPEQRKILADRLLGLPLTAVLFLKHLEHVEIQVDADGRKETRSLSMTRDELTPTGWQRVAGLTSSGTYRVTITEAGLAPWTFVLAHDADIPLTGHRSGLDPYAWDGIEMTEISLAAPHPADGRPLPMAWRRFHVFLPTAEPIAHGLLVNGAFATDLSRQEIRVGAASDDYNRYLIDEAARLFRDALLPALQSEGISVQGVLELLERPADAATRVAGAGLHEAIVEAMRSTPLLPSPDGGVPMSIGRTAIPPPLGDHDLGPRFRELLADDAEIERHRIPIGELCAARYSLVLADLGARQISVPEAATLLADSPPERTCLVEHPTAAVRLDPVLDVLVEYWMAATPGDREALATIVRQLPLFPVAVAADQTVTRVATTDVACFYPPRHLLRDVPLDGLRFLLHEVCWGELLPRDRNELLHDRMSGWFALFDIREFRFPDVMRASVLPALDLAEGDQSPAAHTGLESVERLAAICQLSGRTPKPGTPLPYERLGSDRALFNLARLPVPCRGSDGAPRWVPAYRAYFGTDWIGDESAETILEAVAAAGVAREASPTLDFLVAPSELAGLLARYSDLQQASIEAADDDRDSLDDEVSADEDEEGVLDVDEHARWTAFLGWIGVNRCLRPIHFHDVGDRATGWLTTRGLQRPRGEAFVTLPKSWDNWHARVKDEAHKLSPGDQHKVYLTRAHTLDALLPLLRLASTDKTATIARALYGHLARNWSRLERFSRAEIALVPKERDPGMRARPPRPLSEELREVGHDYWFSVLRSRAFVPTAQGPRKPAQAWLQSAEATRRFGRRAQAAAELLPIVDGDPGLPEARQRAFASALGIRAELTPATFRPPDAKLLTERLATLFAGACEANTLSPEQLRRVIRPAYRNMFELLAGDMDRRDATAGEPELAEAQLLVTDGRGAYRFDPAAQSLYVDRPATRDRLGSDNPLWAFVLESTPAARGPLTRLFGARVLEHEVDWRPTPGEPALSAEEKQRFLHGMRSLRPYLLSRLRVERSEEQQAITDSRRLTLFTDTVELVDRLEVSAFLDGKELSARSAREAFVQLAPDGGLQTFIRWSANGWPPTPFEAEALASALADLYQASMFEPFLTLVQAHSDELRLRLLRLAGASTVLTDIEPVWVDTQVEEDPLVDVLVDPTAPGAEVDDEPPVSPGDLDPDFRVPLFRPDQLVIDSVPEELTGELVEPGTETSERTAAMATAVSRASRGYQGLTDLGELDRLGMSIAIAYEHARLTRAGASDPSVLVFDVSTPQRLQQARAQSQDLERAVGYLLDHGLDQGWPGFDILTLDPCRPAMPDRLIELKSSGVNATTQSMTWNEWKSARHSDIRRFFYLYLAGNLRSDLAHAAPFLRAIPDPFATLWSEEVTTTKVHRTIALNVLQFERAEYLELTVLVDRVQHDPPT